MSSRYPIGMRIVVPCMDEPCTEVREIVAYDVDEDIYDLDDGSWVEGRAIYRKATDEEEIEWLTQRETT